MKTTYRHLIKILSCSLAIIAVLLCSMYVPAMAASWTILHPADYIDTIYYEGNIRNVRYDFKRTALHVYGGGAGTLGSIQAVPTGSTTDTFTIYPLGVKFTGGPPLPAISSAVVIDVSDFKSDAFLMTSSSLFIEFDVNYTAMDQYVSERFSVSATWSFAGYNSSGNYLGSVESASYQFTSSLQDVYVNQQYCLELPFTMTISPMEFGSNVAFVAPSCQLRFSVTEDNSDINIDYYRVSCGDFTITTHTDMLMKNSATMQAIEDQLGDLNDKADELISGSDGMQDAADDFSGTAGDAAQDMNDALDQLEELPEANADDVDMTFDGLLNDNGFKTYGNFFMMLSVDTLWAKVMIIVCTFIWISTLLFGRRG